VLPKSGTERSKQKEGQGLRGEPAKEKQLKTKNSIKKKRDGKKKDFRS